MEYHKRRTNEKLHEISLRVKDLQKTPIHLSDESQLNQLTQSLQKRNIREFNEQWAYQPVELYGKFDHGREIQIKTFKNGEEGFQIYTPFYFLDSNNNEQAIFVDRGWIDEAESENHKHKNGQIGHLAIRGVLTQGNPKTKHTSENNIADNEWFHVDLHDMSALSRLPNRDLAGKVLLKQIEISPEQSSVFPLTEGVKNLTEFNTHPEQHAKLSRIFGGLTFLNLFCNMAFWVCL